jgi:hypothetical protein
MKPEDIKKENIYKVPDGYFEELPMRIQSKISEEKQPWFVSFNWKPAVNIAIPVLAVLLMIVYFVTPIQNSSLNAEELLAQVSSEDVIAYLETTDITTDEILEELDFSETYLDFELTDPALEVPELDQNEINELMDEYGIDSELL